MGIGTRGLRFGLIGLISSFAAICVFAAGAEEAKLSTIKYGSVGAISDAGIYLANELGYFRNAGVAIEFKRMANGPALITAIATNQLDAAGIAITPGLFVSVSQGLNLKIVGDKQSVGKRFAGTKLAVRRESVAGGPANLVHALKGKSVGVTAKASVTFFQLRDLLVENGMSLADLRAVEMPYPSLVLALANGALDGAILTEPYLTQALQLPDVMLGADLVHDKQVTTVALVFSERFAADKALAQRFMTAYVKGVRAYNDAMLIGKDKDRVLEIIARQANLSVDFIRDVSPPGLDPNQEVDKDFLARVQDFFVEQGYIQKPVDVRTIIDTSFADAAVRELGRYTVKDQP